MKDPKARKDKRTTVSLAQVVWDWAEDLMEAKGYNDNFSAYVAELIRRDKEREDEKKAAAPVPAEHDRPSSKHVRSEAQAFVEDELKRRKQKPPQS